jgi:hypothetical protein
LAAHPETVEPKKLSATFPTETKKGEAPITENLPYLLFRYGTASYA